MNEHELAILRQFCLDAEPASCTPYGCGHINRTYLVATAGGRCYILQKINHHTFRDVAGLMENIELVTEHLRRKSPDPRSVLTLIRTKDGKSYLEADDGYWRVFRFVEDSICLQQPESDADFYESAVGFGTFQQLLSDFPAEKLHETIPNFHNTPDRYRAFHETLTRDPMHRAAQVQPEIEFALARQAEMAALQNALDAGELPLRVTHNDTKINNILFDRQGRVLCVIDLDTVLRSPCFNDFGDAIRTYANHGREDDENLDDVWLDMTMFRGFAEGYLSEARAFLTPAETDALAFSVRYITYEQVLRFLMDYLDGDTYYKIKSPDHNLVRTRAQYALLRSAEERYDAMRAIVAELAARP